MYCFDSEWLRARLSISCSCTKIPLKNCYFTLFPIQLDYENAENVESFGQAMMRTQRSEPWKAAPWQRGWQSQALSLLRWVQCRKMFLECLCESLSLALCLGVFTSILLQQRFPISWNKIKCTFMGALPFKSTDFPVKMKVSHKLHLWFPQDFSLLLCFGSLRPLWYLSKAFTFAHLILIMVYGNGNSLPPQGSNSEKESEYSMIVWERGILHSVLTISPFYSSLPHRLPLHTATPWAPLMGMPHFHQRNHCL